MLISVIVPIYNVEKHLDKCISSIRNQTYQNLQIILVNDGSTDKSGDICEKYALQDSRIQVIHKPNGGLVSARKAGLSAARGEYVGYVDSDDYIESDMYEKMLKEMIDSDVDLVVTDIFMDMGEESICVPNRIEYGTYDVEEIIPIMLCDDNFNECRLKPYLVTKLFKKSLLESVQFSVDERIAAGEDAAVTYPYVLRCQKMSILNYCGYHYVQHLKSMIHTKTDNEWNKNITLIKGMKENFVKDIHADILLKELNQYAKLLLMIRNISYFDQGQKEKYLYPFGGIDKEDNIIIYGAGTIGQSVYYYLSGIKDIKIVEWLDREYLKYQQIGLKVHKPENIDRYIDRSVKIIIAINSGTVAESVHKWLMSKQVKEECILWLTEDFIEKDLLSELMDDPI